MKSVKIFFFSALFLLACNSQKKESSVIAGQLQNAANQKVYFERITAQGDVPVDSAVTDANGKFTLANGAAGLDYYMLRTGKQNVAYLVLKGGESLTVSGDASNLEHSYQVEGSEDTKLLVQMKRYEQQLSDSMNKIYAAFRNDNPFSKDSAGAALQAGYDSLIRNYALGLVRNHLTSLVSLSATQYLNKQRDAALFEELNDSLKKALGDNPYVTTFSKMVDDMKRLPPGSMAPEINLPSPEGKEIALSTLKGKVVVIDFWASWCGPCRREMPEMVVLYKNFKSRGLEIYGVSLDDNADAWKNAITHDNMQWIQVSELKKWDSKVAALYGIEEIPQTILLDREGRIVAKGLSMEELKIKMQELLAKS